MLKGFFDVLLKVTDPRPKYIGSRCLVEKNSVGGCDSCLVACPHDAVRISDRVELLESCTGCGLCVQGCPSGALEFNLLPTLAALKDQGVASDESPLPARLSCSKVMDDGPKILCLGQVTPALLMVSAAWGQSLELVHSDCASCKLGGPDVPKAIESVVAVANAYRERLAAPNVQVTIGAQTQTVEPPRTRPFSRREAMGQLFSSGKRNAANLIPDRPLPGVDAQVEAPRVPDEWAWRKKALKPRPDEQTLQHWPAPVVNDDCIFCPVCQNVCPTQAIHREQHSDGAFSITLEVEACTGCDACVKSCPPSAMRLENDSEFGRLSQTVVLHEGFGPE